jgi:hypothetical protein
MKVLTVLSEDFVTRQRLVSKINYTVYRKVAKSESGESGVS